MYYISDHADLVAEALQIEESIEAVLSSRRSPRPSLEWAAEDQRRTLPGEALAVHAELTGAIYAGAAYSAPELERGQRIAVAAEVSLTPGQAAAFLRAAVGSLPPSRRPSRHRRHCRGTRNAVGCARW